MRYKTKGVEGFVRLGWKAFLPMVISIIIWILGAVSASAEDSGFEDSLIQGQLQNREVESVKDAVDKAVQEGDLQKVFDLSTYDLLQDVAKGNPLDQLKGIPKGIGALLGKELKANIGLILELLAVFILSAIIKGLQTDEKGISSSATQLAVSGTMAVIAAASFGAIVTVAKDAIESMQTLASVAMPALVAMMAASGRIVSVAAFQPIMLLGVNGACHILKNILLPLAVMAGILFLVNSISDRFKLKNLAKFIKSCATWGTGTLTLIFSLALTVQRIASSSVDQVTLKTAKFAIGTFIPVAGKNMSDAAEALLACANAARNATGILTILGLGVVVIIPFIKIFVIMMAFKLAAAVGAPTGNEAICDALDDSAGCMSVMLGIVGASLFVMVILTGTLMNSGGIVS